jgi:hypothetical protein
LQNAKDLALAAEIEEFPRQKGTAFLLSRKPRLDFLPADSSSVTNTA